MKRSEKNPYNSRHINKPPMWICDIIINRKSYTGNYKIQHSRWKMGKKGLLFLIMFAALVFTSCTFEVRSGGESYYTPPPFYTLVTADNRYIFYNDGQPVAVWTFMDDGTVERSGAIIDGPVRVYSAPGVLACEMNFSNNMRTGECTYYFSNGQVSERGFYSNGIRIGDWNDYYENGTVYRRFSCRNDGSISIGFESQAGARPEFFGGVGYASLSRDSYRMRPVAAEFNASAAVGYGAHASFGAVVKNNTVSPAAQDQARAQQVNGAKPENNQHAVGFAAQNRQVTQPNVAAANVNPGQMQAQQAVKSQPAQTQAKGKKGNKGNKQNKMNKQPGNNKKSIGINPPVKNINPNKNAKPKKTPGMQPK
jgi:antitoxin component YwqK of YwqJK toxin-antitoxin module